MAFDDMLNDDMDNVFMNSSEFAEEIIYTTEAGNATTIDAVVVRKLSGEDYVRGTEFVEQAIVYIPKTSSGIASPSHLDTVTFDSKIWAITRIVAQNAQHAKLHVARSTPEEKGRNDYRFRNK